MVCGRALGLLLATPALVAAAATCDPAGEVETLRGPPDFSAYPPDTLVAVPQDFELETPDAMNFGSTGRIADPRRYVLVARRGPEGGCRQRSIGCTGPMPEGASWIEAEIGHDFDRCLILYEAGFAAPPSASKRALGIAVLLSIPSLLLLLLYRGHVIAPRVNGAALHAIRSVVWFNVIAASLSGLLFAAWYSLGPTDSVPVLAVLCIMPALPLALPLVTRRAWTLAVACIVAFTALVAGTFNSGMHLGLVWLVALTLACLSAILVAVVAAWLAVRRGIASRREARGGTPP